MVEDALYRRLHDALGERVRPRMPLGPLTTLRVGGPATALVEAQAPDDLVVVADACAELQRPWLVVGRGSNLLVADEGFPGVAIVLGRGFRGVAVDGTMVTAGAAEPMPVLATTVARRGLAGLAFGIAIPGSLGGAVRMNAGAHGGEIGDVLVDVDVVRLAAGGARERLPASDLDLSYRHSALPADAVVVSARLALREVPPAQLEEEMRELRRWRREHQPINDPSCGSVFRNPPGDSAGRLVEAAGMKGHRRGAAAVSSLHANFITVEPGATAADVHAVLLDVQRAVADRTGVVLEPEVVRVGFAQNVVDGRAAHREQAS